MRMYSLCFHKYQSENQTKLDNKFIYSLNVSVQEEIQLDVHDLRL